MNKYLIRLETRHAWLFEVQARDEVEATRKTRTLFRACSAEQLERARDKDSKGAECEVLDSYEI